MVTKRLKYSSSANGLLVALYLNSNLAWFKFYLCTVYNSTTLDIPIAFNKQKRHKWVTLPSHAVSFETTEEFIMEPHWYSWNKNNFFTSSVKQGTHLCIHQHNVPLSFTNHVLTFSLETTNLPNFHFEPAINRRMGPVFIHSQER